LLLADRALQEKVVTTHLAQSPMVLPQHVSELTHHLTHLVEPMHQRVLQTKEVVEAEQQLAAAESLF
jgi:hypothetical protein